MGDIENGSKREVLRRFLQHPLVRGGLAAAAVSGGVVAAKAGIDYLELHDKKPTVISVQQLRQELGTHKQGVVADVRGRLIVGNVQETPPIQEDMDPLLAKIHGYLPFIPNPQKKVKIRDTEAKLFPENQDYSKTIDVTYFQTLPASSEPPVIRDGLVVVHGLANVTARNSGVIFDAKTITLVDSPNR